MIFGHQTDNNKHQPGNHVKLLLTDNGMIQTIGNLEVKTCLIIKTGIAIFWEYRNEFLYVEQLRTWIWITIRYTNTGYSNFQMGKIVLIYFALIQTPIRIRIRHGYRHNFHVSVQHIYTNISLFTHMKVMIFGGTDNTTLYMALTLAALLSNPDVLKKVQDQLEIHVGKNRVVEYSDIENLTYLQDVIKEVFRLYPSAQLNVPHEATGDCQIQGFNVPDTRIH
ncbi:cytochrome P450 CYP82D47-like [Iris pallida]|uniref:Cytochrome P450 CYP82D47-like n=1 Tax=Iris pallida TaxID=29817 RepID=A0AAX6EFD6_IRIPA|nr:cytochrome P450 CYP82D47-like [Iris pallida]